MRHNRRWRGPRGALLALRPLEWLLQPLPRLVDRALGVVVGLHCQPVLVHRSVALAGGVKDLAKGYVAPEFDPVRLTVATQRIPVGVRACLVVALREEHFSHAVAGQRTLRIDLQRLLVLGQRTVQVALGNQLQPFQNGNAYLQLGGGFEHPVLRIDADAAGPAEGVHHKLRAGASDLDSSAAESAWDAQAVMAERFGNDILGVQDDKS